MLLVSITTSVFLLFICSYAESFERKDPSSLLHIIASATDAPAIRISPRQETPAAKTYSRLLSTKAFSSTIKFERFASDDNVLNAIVSPLFSSENYQLTGEYALSNNLPQKLTTEQARDPPSA